MVVVQEASGIAYNVLSTSIDGFGEPMIFRSIKYSITSSPVTKSLPYTSSPEASASLTETSPTKLTATPSISSSESLVSIGSPLPTQTSLGDTFPSQPSESTDFNYKSVGEDLGGLSAGAKAGIAFGVIIFVLFVVGSVFLVWCMRKSRSGQSNIAGLNMGEIVTEPKPKPEPKLKKYFLFLFPNRKGKARASLSLTGLEPDGAGSRRGLDKECIAQNVVPGSAISQRRQDLNNDNVIRTNDMQINEEESMKAQHHDGKASITSHSAGPTNIYIHKPFGSNSSQGQKPAESEELAHLEEEANRIDEEIASAERLQQLRNERLIIQKRLRDVRRASSGSLSEPQL